MSDLNWNLRDILYHFSDSRLHVFMSIYLHKNMRNRSWPSNELIKEETGLSNTPVTNAIDWLIKSQVIMLVAYDKRVGLELKLPSRKYIYQLTGVVLIGEEYHPYLNLTPEGWEGVAADLELMGNDLLSRTLKDANSLLSRSLLSRTKGIKESLEGSKVKSVSRKRSTPPTPSELHPLIAKWATIRKIDAINIGAPIYSTKDLASAKRMAKWDVPPTHEEIEKAISASKVDKYPFMWLEQDIPKQRLALALAKPTPSNAPTDAQLAHDYQEMFGVKQ